MCETYEREGVTLRGGGWVGVPDCVEDAEGEGVFQLGGGGGGVVDR